ncbi:MAG: 5'/3'-nucleotidase SurE [Candidatus Aminicenantes bacterium]|nr:5'/3'-nucleotidase SurE [Candidatus Aminicenantes bacterium]
MNEPQKLVLLTNDDGYWAAGITALHRQIQKLAQVVIVAPDRERSATSLALTLHHPLRVKEIGTGLYAVDGTPADCVYLAMQKLLPRKPDLILSGINNGPNLGQQDVAYSGTVAGAVQGTFFGIPSMAVSCLSDLDRAFDFDYAAGLARKLAEYFLGQAIPPGITLNINIPPAPFKGLRLTKLGQKRDSPEVVESRDPRRLPYFWIGLSRPVPMGDADSDVEMTKQGFVSLTPLHSDLTSYETLNHPLLSRLATQFKQE